MSRNEEEPLSTEISKARGPEEIGEVYTDIEAQARARGIMPETLVNLWLAERLHQT